MPNYQFVLTNLHGFYFSIIYNLKLLDLHYFFSIDELVKINENGLLFLNGEELSNQFIVRIITIIKFSIKIMIIIVHFLVHL